MADIRVFTNHIVFFNILLLLCNKLVIVLFRILVDICVDHVVLILLAGVQIYTSGIDSRCLRHDSFGAYWLIRIVPDFLSFFLHRIKAFTSIFVVFQVLDKYLLVLTLLVKSGLPLLVNFLLYPGVFSC